MATNRNSYGWTSNPDSQTYGSGQARSQNSGGHQMSTQVGSFGQPGPSNPNTRNQRQSGFDNFNRNLQQGGGSLSNTPGSFYNTPGFQPSQRNYGAGGNPQRLSQFQAQNYYGGGHLPEGYFGGEHISRVAQMGRGGNPFQGYADSYGGQGGQGGGMSTSMGMNRFGSVGGAGGRGPGLASIAGVNMAGASGSPSSGPMADNSRGMPADHDDPNTAPILDPSGDASVGDLLRQLYDTGGNPEDFANKENRRRIDAFVEKYFAPMTDVMLQRDQLGLGGYDSQRDFNAQQEMNAFNMGQEARNNIRNERALDIESGRIMGEQELGWGDLGLRQHLGEGELALGQYGAETERGLGQGRLNLDTMLGTGQLQNEQFDNTTRRIGTEGGLANDMFANRTTRMLGQEQNRIEDMWRRGQISNDQFANMTNRLQQQHQAGFDYSQLEAQERMAQAQRESELMQARYGAFGRAQAPVANFATGWS